MVDTILGRVIDLSQRLRQTLGASYAHPQEKLAASVDRSQCFNIQMEDEDLMIGGIVWAFNVLPPRRVTVSSARGSTFGPKSENHGPDPAIEYQRFHSCRYRKLGSTDTGMSNGF
jgi:hypothetical protein